MQRYEDITTERARPIAATIVLVTPSLGDYFRDTIPRRLFVFAEETTCVVSAI